MNKLEILESQLIEFFVKYKYFPNTILIPKNFAPLFRNSIHRGYTWEKYLKMFYPEIKLIYISGDARMEVALRENLKSYE